jgi:propanediol utilization protein
MQTAPGRDDGFLYGVGGFVIVAQHADSHVEEGILVAKDEFVEGIEVAALGQCDPVIFFDLSG